MPTSEVYNMDCLEYMRTLPDDAFDLCIADPPYGDGLHAEGGECKGCFSKYHQNNDARSQSVQVERERESRYNRFGNPGSRFERYKRDTDKERTFDSRTAPGDMPSGEPKRGGSEGPTRTGGTWAEKYGKKIIAWDVAPSEEYFEQIFRVSRNQIIWGGNYFHLPPTRCFLIWRKLTISENFTMAMAEYAWTSFDSNAKVFEAAPQGRPGDDRFHPTQKPVALYKWILSRYAKPGDKIFDPYLGSGSSRIAAWDMGFDFVGCELDKTYFALEEERFNKHTAQTRMDL